MYSETMPERTTTSLRLPSHPRPPKLYRLDHQHHPGRHSQPDHPFQCARGCRYDGGRRESEGM
ncbi:MAG: hypothetical protein MIO93_11940, partial [ANME-2 cluster archaeon]|nr:hypothetical protein [ANME-2 cluster archaeon]